MISLQMYVVYAHKNRLDEYTHHTFILKNTEKMIILAQSTLNGSNYPVSNNFHSPKSVRAIKVRLYCEIFNI